MKARDHWILDDMGEPIECEMMEWAVWPEKSKDRFVKKDMVGEIRVSTVFLGIDHNFSDEGPPVLWETMVFGGAAMNDYQDRCSGSRQDALDMHNRTLEMVKESLNLKEHLDYQNMEGKNEKTK